MKISKLIFIYLIICLVMTLAQAQNGGNSYDDYLLKNKLILPKTFDDPFNTFGGAISIYQDKQSVVGAYGAGKNGAAYIFTNETNGYYQTRHTLYPDEFGADFGFSVATFGDIVAVGDWVDKEHVESSGAVYIYQYKLGGWYMIQKLKDPNPDDTRYFGSDIEIHGNYLAVTSGQSDFYNKPGGLFIYKFENGKFELMNRFLDDLNSLALTVELDSNYVAVGSANDDFFASEGGKVKVYKNSGNNWAFETNLIHAGVQGGDNFGLSVTIENESIFANYSKKDGSNNIIGGVLQFEKIGNAWIQTNEIIPNQIGYLGFGSAMDIQNDSLFISSTNKNYFFKYQNNNWEDQNLISNSPGISFKGKSRILTRTKMFDLSANSEFDLYGFENDYLCDFDGCTFGSKVSISESSAIIGSESGVWIYCKQDTNWRLTTIQFNVYGVNNISCYNNRALISSRLGNDEVLVMKKNGVTWEFEDTIALIPNTNFGKGLAIYENTIVIGAPTQMVGGEQTGAVYMYEYDQGWTLQKQFIPPIPDSHFAEEIDIHKDWIIVGAWGENDQGAAYLYKKENGIWQYKQTIASNAPQQFARFSRAVSVSDSTIVVGAPGEDIGFDNDAGAVYVFQLNGTWSFFKKILPANNFDFDYCGSAVSISQNNLMYSCPGRTSSGMVFIAKEENDYAHEDSFMMESYSLELHDENFVIGDAPDDYVLLGQTSVDCFNELFLYGGSILPYAYQAKTKINVIGMLSNDYTSLSAPNVELKSGFEEAENFEVFISGCQN